jgi:hypothetical protein
MTSPRSRRTTPFLLAPNRTLEQGGDVRDVRGDVANRRDGAHASLYAPARLKAQSPKRASKPNGGRQIINQNFGHRVASLIFHAVISPFRNCSC